MSFKHNYDGYESAFEEDETNKRKNDFPEEPRKKKKASVLPDRNVVVNASTTESRRNYQKHFTTLSVYNRHVLLVNQYLLYHSGATALLKRDTSRDKRDLDVMRENHKFLWNNDQTPNSWGEKLAKKYFDKLFKEYCICDLSRYKENKIGMRWRTKQEVIDGRGQFSCGNKRCLIKDNLRTWEMNFGYVEHDEKKNALVKLRLCHECSYKVNYAHKRKEVTREKVTKSKKETASKQIEVPCSEEEPVAQVASSSNENAWTGNAPILEQVDREEEFQSYLQDLLL